MCIYVHRNSCIRVYIYICTHSNFLASTVDLLAVIEGGAWGTACRGSHPWGSKSPKVGIIYVTKSIYKYTHIWLFPITRGPYFQSPYHEDPGTLELLLGPPIIGDSHMDLEP